MNHKIKKISGNIWENPFKISTSNVRRVRCKIIPTVTFPWQRSRLRTLFVKNQISPFLNRWGVTDGPTWNTCYAHITILRLLINTKTWKVNPAWNRPGSRSVAMVTVQWVSLSVLPTLLVLSLNGITQIYPEIFLIL